MEIITAIALLCQISHSTTLHTQASSMKDVDKRQLECQRYYISCVKDIDMTLPSQLAKCIKDRKVL